MRNGKETQHITTHLISHARRSSTAVVRLPNKDPAPVADAVCLNFLFQTLSNIAFFTRMYSVYGIAMHGHIAWYVCFPAMCCPSASDSYPSSPFSVSMFKCAAICRMPAM